MALHQIQLNEQQPRFPVFNLGFRIFFLAAALLAIASITVWGGILHWQWPVNSGSIPLTHWHAHEMLHGYAMAVIAGFLLTAVRNWTGLPTPQGKMLALLFIPWLVARLAFLTGQQILPVAFFADMLFVVCLATAISYPIIKTQQWRQLAVLAKLILLGVCNLAFYLGASGQLEQGLYWGNYGALYLVIGLILTMGRRVVPFFIERGVGYEVTLFNSNWLDFSSLGLFLVLFISELFLHNPLLSSVAALALFVINAIRLIGWHTPGIWKKSLLWSLYLAMWLISFGLLLLGLVYWLGISKFIAIHALGFGGIGLITLSMMSRVALGHTGRNIHQPPAVMPLAFVLLMLGAAVRTLLPLIDSSHYLLWVGVSQLLWLAAFAIFTWVYFPILTQPRVDGAPG